MTAVFPGGLAAAPSVWGFTEDLGKKWRWRLREGPRSWNCGDTDTPGFFTVPLAGPAVWRLQDDPPGTPAVAWEEVPRPKLRGRATHYTLCIQGEAIPTVCTNGELPVSGPFLYPQRSTCHPRCRCFPSSWEFYVTKFPENSNSLVYL